MISFKAKLLGETTVKCYNNEKYAYEDCPAYFIRFDKHSKADLQSVLDVSKSWRPKDRFAKNIAKNFSYEYTKKFNTRYNNNFFALTIQKDKFKNVDPTKVLGMAEILKKGKTFSLEFLQVDPKYNYGVKNRKFKNAGLAIIESLKNMRNIKSIILIPSAISTEFYKKCGFEEVAGMMQYTKNKSTSFYKNLLNIIKLKNILKRKLG